MNFIKNNKYHFGGLTIVILLFFLSVVIRSENIAAPLSRHHEWITAHTLITCEIWSENGGPSNYHFSPVYSYPGEGNARRTMLGGVVDSKGDVYYVSYPPFTFIFAYYFTKFIGGPDLHSMRVMTLFLHLSCALLIYLLAATFLPEAKRYHISIAGLLGATLYIFSTGNLWAHGNLYFADMLVQVFIISGLFLTSLFLQNKYKNFKGLLIAFFVIFFLAVYTEWLGLFLSFFTGITFLIYYFLRREKKFLFAFFTIAFSAVLAVLITIIQYSSIAGWDRLKEVSIKKYTQRSGHATLEESPNAFNLENHEAFDFMIGNIDRFYLMAENILGLVAIILGVILIIPNARRRIENPSISFVITVLLLLSILTHYYLFFNFNSLHDFSSLKTGFAIILLIIVCTTMIESVLSKKWNVFLVVSLTIVTVFKVQDAVRRYNEIFPVHKVNWAMFATADAMKTYGHPDKAIFMNIKCNPELTYAAHHNVFPVEDTSQILGIMNYYNNTKGQYYHHRANDLEYIQEFEVVNNRMVYLNRYKVGSLNSSGGKMHQK